jgi:hypothetical protein
MILMPYRYQGREAQAQAIAQARHWLDRLAQLNQFERVVLGGHGDDRDGRAGRSTEGRAASGRLERR